MTTAQEPAWLGHARKLLGTREAPGAASNPTILGWARRLGNKIVGMVYNADSVPWCGLFAAHCMSLAGIAPPSIAVRASAWDKWGDPVAPACLGAVLRFARDGGGHVGFAVGEDQTHYHVLGGNQGDCVSIVRIEKKRLVASRMPAGWTGPRLRLPAMRAMAGVAISRNEA